MQEENMNEPKQPPVEQTPYSVAPKPGGNEPKNKKLMMIVVLVVAVVAAGILAFVVLGKSKDTSDSTANTDTNKTDDSGKSANLAEPAELEPAEVSITAKGFEPETITVKAGQAVIWKNDDTVPHLVASDPYPSNDTLPELNSKKQLAAGESYSYVFEKSGTFTYHDNLKPTVTGKVIVE